MVSIGLNIQQMEHDPVEWTVYKNVMTFCKYNNIVITEGNDYTLEKTNKIIDIQSFIMMKGILNNTGMDNDGNGVPYYIFIFGQKSTTVSKTAFGNKADDIANVMGLINEQKAAIMFVSESSFKANVTRAIATQKRKKDAMFQIQSVVHDIFKVDRILTSKFKHEILSTSEALRVKAQHEKNLTSIPYIPVMDPMVIWIIGRPKQVVKITHPSLVGCVTVYYRVIR